MLFRETGFRETRSSPNHVLAACHHVPPQINTLLNLPNTRTHKKLCDPHRDSTGTVTWTAAKGSREAQASSIQERQCCWHPEPQQRFAERERGHGRASASPSLPSTELPLLSVTSPGRGLPYYIRATKVTADV